MLLCPLGIVQAIGRFTKAGAAATQAPTMDVDEKEFEPVPTLPNGFGVSQDQLLELLEVSSFTELREAPTRSVDTQPLSPWLPRASLPSLTRAPCTQRSTD